MSEAMILEKIEMLNPAVARLQQRVEDLEAAIVENDGKPYLIPWEEAQAELDND